MENCFGIGFLTSHRRPLRPAWHLDGAQIGALSLPSLDSLLPAFQEAFARSAFHSLP